MKADFSQTIGIKLDGYIQHIHKLTSYWEDEKENRSKIKSLGRALTSNLS